MSTALYHKAFGYYASKNSRLGKGGDFFTSVSVGEVFGKILARRIAEMAQHLQAKGPFHIVEMGANNGDLAIDIMSELHASSNLEYHYHIIEPLKHLRKKQRRQVLRAELEHIFVYKKAKSLKQLEGVFLSNELIDAFPVEQIKLESGIWKQLFIGAEAGQFTEVWQPIEDPELLRFTQSLGTQFEEGYRTEYRPGVKSFCEQVREIIAKGYVIAVDYGFPRSHLYDKNRKNGTLQTYQKHRKADNPLLAPGEADITSHIDFTQVASEFQASGFQVLDFVSQQKYLTQHGAEWLKSLEKDFSNEMIPLIKQFQTLTHPEMMGQKFHVLEMATEGLLGIASLGNEVEELLEL